MIVLFIFLVVLGLSSSIVTASLINSGRGRVLFVFLQNAVIIVCLPFLLKLELRKIVELRENPEVIQNLSLLIIVESVLSFFTGLAGIRAHYGVEREKKAAFLFYLPSLTALAGLLWAVAVIFNSTAGMNYWMLAFVCFAGFSLVQTGTVWVLLRLLKEWGSRIELKMTLNLISCLVAACIPLLLNRTVIAGNAIQPSVPDLLILLGIIAVGIGLGYGLNIILVKIRNKNANA